MRTLCVSLASLVLASTSFAMGIDQCALVAVNVFSSPAGASCCTAPTKMRSRRHLFSRTDTCSDGTSPCCDTKAPGPPVVSSGGTANLQCGRNYDPNAAGSLDNPGGVTYTLEACPSPGTFAGQTCFHVELTALSTGTITDIHLFILDGSGDVSTIPTGLGQWPLSKQPSQYCSFSGNVGNCWVPVSVVLAVLNPPSDSLCGQDIIVAAGIAVDDPSGSPTCFAQGTVIGSGTGRWFSYTTVTFTCPDICTHSCCCPTTPPPPPPGHWCDIGTAFGYKPGTPNFNGNPVGPAISATTCKRWGWYFIVPTSTLSGGITGDLLVGAGGNDVTKATDVGSFTATLSGTALAVTYSLTSGFDLSEVHVYASCNKPTSCAPGSYTYPGSAVLDLSATTDTHFETTITVASCSTYYLIFHAKVNQSFPADVTCPATAN